MGKPPQRRPARRNKPTRTPARAAAGLASRALAVDLLHKVLKERSGLDEALAASYQSDDGNLDARDRGFARVLTTTVLRRYGQLRAVIDAHLAKPLPASGFRADLILLVGAAQLLFLNGPAHAVIDTAVSLSRQRKASARFDKLINAVLRRISEAGPAMLATQDSASLNIPEWMLAGWRDSYGDEQARDIAVASLREAALDITVKDNVTEWADKLQATVLKTGSLRRANEGRIDKLPGFEDGAWWVQDAAAALPAKLLGDVSGLTIADLCAAPGGKTAQLASCGAHVVALDLSADRLNRVRENLNRLRLEAEIVTGDASTWSPNKGFDAVLADAPCTATGTIRRHPDILHLKRPEDIDKMTAIQAAILDNAARLVKPGGQIIYCTCSLERREGEDQVEQFLKRHGGFERVAIQPDEVSGLAEFITTDGDLRTLPTQLAQSEPELSGIDGFFACRLKRQA